MSPGSVQRPGKAKGGKRLVRYYVSQKAIREGYRHCPIKTINTGHLDDLVRALVLDYLRDESVDYLDRQEAQVRDHWIRTMIDEVRLAPDELVMQLDVAKITACREHEWPRVDGEHKPGRFPTCLYRPSVERRQRYVILTLPLEIKRLDGRRMLLSPNGHDLVIPSQREPKDHIVKAIGLAYRWCRALTNTGRTINGVAKEHGVSEGRVRRLLPLTQLSPQILKLSLTGELAPSITLNDLLATAEHLDWSKQANALGLRDQPDQTRIPVVPIAPPPLPPG